MSDGMRRAVGKRELIVTGLQPGIEEKESLHRCLYLPNILPNNCDVKVAVPEAERLHGQEYNIAVANYVAQHPEVTFMNPRDALCKNGMCYALIDGQIVYSDLIHLTKAGASYVLEAYLMVP